MILKNEVNHIARLAKLSLTEKEKERMQKDLSSILDYFTLLKKAPKFNTGKKSVVGLLSTRKDENISQDPATVKEMSDAFPNKKNGYIKVKSIL